MDVALEKRNRRRSLALWQQWAARPVWPAAQWVSSPSLEQQADPLLSSDNPAVLQALTFYPSERPLAR